MWYAQTKPSLENQDINLLRKTFHQAVKLPFENYITPIVSNNKTMRNH